MPERRNLNCENFHIVKTSKQTKKQTNAAYNLLLAEVKHDAAQDLALAELVENVIDVADAVQLAVDLHQASAAVVDSLLEILAGSHDRAADGDSLEHDVEDGAGEFARGEAHGHDGAAATSDVDGRLEDTVVGGEAHDAVAAAAGDVHDLLDDIGALGVDGELGAQLRAVGELVRADVHGDHAQAHGLGVLDAEVAETARGADDGDEFSGLGLGLLDALVGSDAGAEDRCINTRMR
jgi:hypothetical protein